MRSLLVLVTLGVLWALPPALHPDLQKAIAQVKEGEFEAAVLSLDALLPKLAAEPARRSELALAYLYQGVAFLELTQEGLAKGKFHEALKKDAGLRLDPAEFSAQQIRLFELARREATAAAAPPPTPAPTAQKKGGSGKGIAIALGGAAVVGVGVAAAGGGGSSTPAASATTTATTAPTTTAPATTTPASICLSISPSWVTPSSGQTVSGTINLVCSVPADLNCQGMYMEFRRCSGDCVGQSSPAWVGMGNVFNSPNYSVPWDTRTVPNGTQTILCMFHWTSNVRGPVRTVTVRN